MAFLVAWTFWIGSWIGNAAIITAIIRYLTPFFPILSSNGIAAFLVIISFFMGTNLYYCRGVKQAGMVGNNYNYIKTCCNFSIRCCCYIWI